MNVINKLCHIVDTEAVLSNNNRCSQYRGERDESANIYHWPTAALPPKADIRVVQSERLLMTQSGHSSRFLGIYLSIIRRRI